MFRSRGAWAKWLDTHHGEQAGVWMKLAKKGTGVTTVTYADAEMSPQLHGPAEADALAIQSSERAAINRAIADLPTEFREVIVLREVQEMSYKEISTVTGVPIGTVMSRLARARKRLASSLGLHVREAS